MLEKAKVKEKALHSKLLQLRQEWLTCDVCLDIIEKKLLCWYFLPGLCNLGLILLHAAYLMLIQILVESGDTKQF